MKNIIERLKKINITLSNQSSTFKTDCSIGYSIATEETNTLNNYIIQADKKMYKQKMNKRKIKEII